MFSELAPSDRGTSSEVEEEQGPGMEAAATTPRLVLCPPNHQVWTCEVDELRCVMNQEFWWRECECVSHKCMAHMHRDGVIQI